MADNLAGNGELPTKAWHEERRHLWQNDDTKRRFAGFPWSESLTIDEAQFANEAEVVARTAMVGPDARSPGIGYAACGSGQHCQKSITRHEHGVFHSGATLH